VLYGLPDWLWLLGVLFAGDAATTLYALAKFPGAVVEANGLVARVMRAAGSVPGMVALKVGILAWAYWWNDGTATFRDAMVFVSGGYFAVVANNLLVIYRRLKAA
jgi:hypothetical protein